MTYDCRLRHMEGMRARLPSYWDEFEYFFCGSTLQALRRCMSKPMSPHLSDKQVMAL